MDQLIPIASKLQDVLGAVGQSTSLDLPQVVVVGGQSSGKTSVLESLVGRSFLPRGSGIVTRRPLILQLYNVQPKPQDNTPNEWGEFLHKPDKKYFDFNAIRQEIVAETERLTGRNKGVDSKPIQLKIYSPTVLALTVVDLPGIAKVPVGDQPADIEQQIRNMCETFIKNPNAIILAVTPANTDLANSDAIQLAQAVDPTGTRTVGVLTKLDLMDPGTDCADILMNQVIPLRRGYIAVINRGQRDIDMDRSIREGLKKEEAYFKNHPVYSRDRALLQKCGASRLAKALNQMLMHHIRDCLPDLKSRITSMTNDVHVELEALGSGAPVSNKSARGGALLKLLSKFATNFSNLLEGKGCKDIEKNKTDLGSTAIIAELEGGSRLSYVFTDIFSMALGGMGAFDNLTDEEVRITIRNAHGVRNALFVPEISFDILVRKQIERLEQPGVQCVDMIYEELQRIAFQSQPTELTRYPKLRERLNEVVANLLRRCVGPTQMMVSNLVKIELAHLNTSHPDFLGGSRAVARLMDKKGDKVNATIAQTTATVPQAAAAGATPLSSSSLNEYYDDANENEPPMSPEEVQNKGMLNYIFRGNDSHKTPPKKPKQPATKNGPPGVVQVPVFQSVAESLSRIPMSDREKVEMEVIKSLVDSYFTIVRKNFTDLVPKTVMYMLVNHVRDSLQNELVGELYRDGEMANLLKEADDVASRRQTCAEMKGLLDKALEIVNEVRDMRV